MKSLSPVLVAGLLLSGAVAVALWATILSSSNQTLEKPASKFPLIEAQAEPPFLGEESLLSGEEKQLFRVGDKGDQTAVAALHYLRLWHQLALQDPSTTPEELAEGEKDLQRFEDIVRDSLKIQPKR